MDKKALQTYAVWAKNNLENQIEVALKSIGINSISDIKTARKVGDYTIIDDDQNSYSGSMYEKREKIINLIKKEGYEQAIEEFAYTWFNRIVALRFMEVHDFLPHGFRVLSSRDGGFEPEIMKNLNYVVDDFHIDLSIVSPLIAQGKIDEAFRYVLFRQCNALSSVLPMLFEKDDSYMELMLPKALLKGETFITKLVELGEEPFLNDVEVIGWLYQFYVSSDRQEFRNAKVVTKDLIPTLTQVFTPDWIVKYMAENSIGRVWLESYPNSTLRSQMKYYVDDAKQEFDIQKKIYEIKYKNVNPEDIRIIEPCCGSGHILVYVFDLLYKMYEEKGYQPREIPTLILKKNIVGLEIDKRASQLASFSLVMKARTMNSRFFSNNYFVIPEVYEILESGLLISLDYKKHIQDSKCLNNTQINAIESLVEDFRYGKTIGSLLKIERRDFKDIRNSIETLHREMINNLFNSNFYNEGIPLLRKLLREAEVMSAGYDVMITNPPYLGISKMEKEPKEYLTNHYPNSKADMFAMFMEAPYVKKNGFIAMVNPDSWMFLVSFEQLRKKIIKEQSIVNMIHLGMGAFDATVQTTSFVIRNASIGGNGVYFRLVDEKDKEAAFLAGGGIIMNLSSYNSIPSNIIGYWLSKKTIENFQLGKIGDDFIARTGMATADNDTFLRLWYEVNLNNVCFTATDSIYSVYTGKKWFPYNKGGDFRRWYGNNEYLINWYLDGKEVKNNIDPKTKRIRSHNYNDRFGFIEGITWTEISSGNYSARISEKGFLFDSAGAKMFSNDENIDYSFCLAYINSIVAQHYLDIIAPTLHYKPGDLLLLPYQVEDKENIEMFGKNNIELSRQDWDSFETSWDFKKHPLI